MKFSHNPSLGIVEVFEVNFKKIIGAKDHQTLTIKVFQRIANVVSNYKSFPLEYFAMYSNKNGNIPI